MRVALATLAGLLALSTPTWARTSLPDKPQVTVGANMKELVFDWEPVPGAVNYRLLVKTSDNPRVYFEPLGERTRRSTFAIPIAVHQQRWLTTRYIVMACNPAGCTRSDEIYPRDLMLDAIGYFKASNTDSGDHFGSAIAISADGGTMVVSAENEASGSSGVNAGEYDDSMPDAGAVYVFRRDGRKWHQEEYIKAPETAPGAKFGGGSPLRGHTLALSADGNMLLIASPSATVQGMAHAGEVQIYVRDSLSRWIPSLTFHAPTIAAEDYFGYDIDLSSDGTIFKVNSLLPEHRNGGFVGRMHTWSLINGTWTYKLLPQSLETQCRSTRMSANGRTIVAFCRDTLEQGSSLVTYNRQSNGTWISNTLNIITPWTEAPARIALNYAGDRLAFDEGANGVGVYHREPFASMTRWVNDTHIMNPGMTPGGPYESWATALEFDRHGDYLAIGDPAGYAGGPGVSPEPTCCGWTPGEGFVHVWKRVPDANPQWVFMAQVKASNPDPGDQFGHAIAFGGLGWYLAVVAREEASSIGGIDGAQDLNDGPGAGAVYLY